MAMKQPTGLHPSQFGQIVTFPMPEDCDVVLVCINDGAGIKPVQIKLPHQVYKECLDELLEKHKEIVLIPAHSKNYIQITIDSLRQLSD